METVHHSTSSDSDTGVFNDSVQGMSSTATSLENSPPSSTKVDGNFIPVEPMRRIDMELQELFSEFAVGKIWRTAAHLIPQSVGIPLPPNDIKQKFI
jgi:hypothetical protein